MDVTLRHDELVDLLRHPLVTGLLETTSDAALVIDARTRRLLATNGRARDLLSLGPEDEGCCCHDALASPTCRTACPLTRAAEGLPVPATTPLFFQNAHTGSTTHAEARMLRVWNPDGELVAAIELIADQQRVQDLERALRVRRSVVGLAGRSAAMQGLYDQLERLAPCDMPVLILGPGGAGKRRAAEALHMASPRRDSPLEVVDLATVPGALHLSAIRDALQLAGAGSVVITDIDAAEDDTLAVLLDLVETGQATPAGAQRLSLGPSRLLLTACATPPLLARVLAGSVANIPGLDDRLEDLPQLVTELLAQLPGPDRIDEAAVAELCRRSWPGNVSELQRTLAAAAVRAAGQDCIKLADLDAMAPLVASLAETEAAAIRRAMAGVDGNVSAAARVLGIDRSTLWRKLKRLS